MPVIGTRHQGNLRMVNCLTAMWEDYNSGNISEKFDALTYTSTYKVTTIPRPLLMPILKNTNKPTMKDAIELRKQINERVRATRTAKYANDQQGAGINQDNDLSEAELIMKVMSLGYAVFKISIHPITNP